jgi:hypothetical protein
MSIYQANPAGAIYDQAGSRDEGSAFNRNLEAQDKPHKEGERKGQKGGSRYMWPGAESHLPKLRDASAGIMNGVVKDFNRDYKRF